MITITVNGRTLDVPAGITVAAALLNAGVQHFRTAVGGTPRAPLCGMGTCFECRVTIDDVHHQRACMTPVRAGMRVVTGA